MSSSQKFARAERITLLCGVPLAFAVVVVVLAVAGAVAASIGGITTSSAAAPPAWLTLPPLGSNPPGGVHSASAAGGRGAYADVNAIRMWYDEYGPADQGGAAAPPVLLLHGGLADSDYWNDVIPALVAHGRTVIVADSRGHGRSTRTIEPYSYDLMAEDVLALLDYLKIPQVDLVGWSDGGIIGIDIAMSHPERLASLFAYGANTNPDGLIPGGDQAPVSVLGDQRAHEEYLRLSPTPDQWQAFYDQINKMWDTQPNFSDEQLRSVHVRTMIADGQYDEVIKREHTEYIARAIPEAQLDVLPNVSHFGMLQNPAEFSQAVLAFLG